METILRAVIAQRVFLVMTALLIVVVVIAFALTRPASAPVALAPTVPATSTPRPTLTSTPRPTATPTLTATPTSTPTPTFTPVSTLPNPAPNFITESLPVAFNASDTALTNQRFLLHITRVIRTDAIGRFRPSNPNNIYLLMEANLWNASDSAQDFFNTDFEITTLDSLRVDAAPSPLQRANVDLMGEARSANYAAQGRDWPSPNWYAVNRLNLQPQSTRAIILAYEVPQTARLFTLHFHPASLNPATLQVFFAPVDGTAEVSLFSMARNDEPLYRIVDVQEGRIITISPRENFNVVECIENCQSRPLQARFSREIEVSQFTAEEIELSGRVQGLDIWALRLFGASLEYSKLVQSEVQEERQTSLSPMIDPNKALEMRETSADVEKELLVTLELVTGERTTFPYRVRGIETTTALVEDEAECAG